MWSDLQCDYSSSTSAAIVNRRKCVDLLGRWKEDQTFLKIPSPILEVNIWSGSRDPPFTEESCVNGGS